MAEGVWRTIKGRHVYIRKGESIRDAIDKKKNEIEENRKAFKQRITDAAEGYENMVKMRQDVNDYTYDKDNNMVIGKKAKPYYDYDKENKYWLRNEKYTSGQTANLAKTNKLNIERGDRETQFRREMADAQITHTDKRDYFVSLANKVYGNQYKSDTKRGELARDFENTVQKYYDKNPVQVNVKAFNKPMMQDALNDLYMTGIKSQDNAKTYDDIINNKLGKSDFQKAFFQSVKTDMKNMSYKNVIDELNNTEILKASDNYIAVAKNRGPYANVKIKDANYYINDKVSYPSISEKFRSFEAAREGKPKEYDIGTTGTHYSIEEAKRYAERINEAADFARGLTNMNAEKMAGEIFANKTLRQAIDMFIAQGYSERTAKRMAKKYIEEHKRK